MKLDIQSIRETDPKKLLKSFIRYYRGHSITILFVLAGILISFALLRVQSLTQFVSNAAEDASSETGDATATTDVSLQKISLDEETVEKLKQLEDDTDVIIDSNLPGNRTNPF